MCGRFAITLPHEAMARLFRAAPDNDLPPIPDYNVCPTADVTAVTLQEGRRRLRALRWGFVAHWATRPDDGPLLINARAESVARKPAFRDAARQRRCLIPASGFFEWSKDEAGTRLPWYVRPTGEGLLALAGIWQDWTDPEGGALTTTAIVTCPANALLAPIHTRMPVIVARDDWPLWLGEEGHGAARLMRPAPEDALACHRVSRKVNSNRATGPGLIEPVEP